MLALGEKEPVSIPTFKFQPHMSTVLMILYLFIWKSLQLTVDLPDSDQTNMDNLVARFFLHNAGTLASNFSAKDSSDREYYTLDATRILNRPAISETKWSETSDRKPLVETKSFRPYATGGFNSSNASQHAISSMTYLDLNAARLIIPVSVC